MTQILGLCPKVELRQIHLVSFKYDRDGNQKKCPSCQKYSQGEDNINSVFCLLTYY